jgi:hypothetical protein
VSRILLFEGAAADVQRAAQQLVASDWVHWFDSIDVVWQAGQQQTVLRVSWNCPADEVAVFDQTVRGVADQHALQAVTNTASSLLDGLPDLTFKLLPCQAHQFLQPLLLQPGLRIVQIASLGVLHVYGCAKNSNVVSDELLLQLRLMGGDWCSRHWPQKAGLVAEAGWRNALLQEFQQT